jgi:hypothetical protein
MGNNKNSKIITFDEASKMPELAHFHEAIQFMEKKPVGSLFPKKYEAALKHVVVRDTQTLFAEHPDMPLKNVVSEILSRLNEGVSADLLLKMTQVIVKEWTNSSANIYAEARVKELV